MDKRTIAGIGILGLASLVGGCASEPQRIPAPWTYINVTCWPEVKTISERPKTSPKELYLSLSPKSAGSHVVYFMTEKENVFCNHFYDMTAREQQRVLRALEKFDFIPADRKNDPTEQELGFVSNFLDK